MTTDNTSKDFHLVPLGEKSVLAVPVEVERSGPAPRLNEMAGAVGPLLVAALGRSGLSGAQIYELSPESQRLLATARKNEIGSYFRGVLRGEDGKVSHQVQLREVRASPAPSGLDAIAAVQLAAIQAQLGRMEEVLNRTALSVDRVVSFQERQQRSALKAAIRMIQGAYDRAAVTARISDADWQRLTGIEFELEAQLEAVAAELEERLTTGAFTGDPKCDVSLMDRIDAERTCSLVDLQRLLISGLCHLHELVLLRKINEGEFEEQEALLTGSRLSALFDQHMRLLGQLETLAAAASITKPRTNWERLFNNGIWLGSRRDDRDLAKIGAARLLIEGSVKNSTAVLALPGAARPQLTAAADTSSYFDLKNS